MLIRLVARRDFKSGHLADFEAVPDVQILDKLWVAMSDARPSGTL